MQKIIVAPAKHMLPFGSVCNAIHGLNIYRRRPVVDSIASEDKQCRCEKTVAALQ